jgi:hypothetical protein
VARGDRGARHAVKPSGRPKAASRGLQAKMGPPTHTPGRPRTSFSVPD